MDLPRPGERVPFKGNGKRKGQNLTAEWHNYDSTSPLPYLVFRDERGRRLRGSPMLSMERIREYFLNLDREITE